MRDVVVEVMMPGGLEPLDPNVYSDPDTATICKQSDDESDLEGDDASFESPTDGGLAMPMVISRSGGKPSSVAAVRPVISARPAAGGRRLAADPAHSARIRHRRLQAAARVIGWGIWPPWPVCPAQETMPAVVKFRYSFMGAGTHSIRFKAIAATPGTFILPPVKAYVEKQPEVMGLSAGGKFTVCGARAASCDTSDQPPPAAPKRCSADCNGNGVCDLATGACICDTGFGGPACATFAVY